MDSRLPQWLHAFDGWLFQERHRAWCAQVSGRLHTAFTEHPREAGETYLQHLWFTARMALRFMVAMIVLMIHGVFPFLLTQSASTQVEKIYRIMRARIPKTRRDEIDIDYTV